MINLEQYKCLPTKNSYRQCLLTKMDCTDHINIFRPVKNRFNFNISNYTGPLPVGIISSDRNTLYGYTNDVSVTSIYKLKPHVSRPPEQYLWSKNIVEQNFTYKDIMYMLNHRCVQLQNPPSVLHNDVNFFEQSRYITWLCIYETKCIEMEKLIELEIRYMKCLVNRNKKIMEICKDLYNLEEATQEKLSEWVKNLYIGMTPDTSTNGLFIKVADQVKHMLLEAV